MVTQSIMVLLLILFSSALLLAHDEKYMYGNPVNSGTVINLICVGLTLPMTRNICMVTRSTMVLLLILFSSALLLAHDEKYMYGNPVNNGTVINFIFVGLTLSS